MGRGLCETCAHYTRHRVRDGRGGWETIRESCEAVAYVFEQAISGISVVRECGHYAAEGETELPFRGG